MSAAMKKQIDKHVAASTGTAADDAIEDRYVLHHRTKTPRRLYNQAPRAAPPHSPRRHARLACAARRPRCLLVPLLFRHNWCARQ
jgi:hypothetical protein